MGKENSYNYGTPLYWLSAWVQRILGWMAEKSLGAGAQHDWMFYRADRLAAEAMLRFEIEYPTLIREIRQRQGDVESRCDELINHRTDETIQEYAAAMELLSARIRAACEIIAERTGRDAGQPSSPDCYVTLLQMSGIVSRSKSTLERLVKKPSFPLPAVQGSGGKPSEWIWSVVRPILEAEFERALPEIFPADRFLR